MNMKQNAGFTLIEIIAVLVILGIMIAVAVPKYVDLQTNAQFRALDAGVAEVNGRENLSWANAKLSNTGWGNDAAVYASVDTALDGEYTWDSGPSVTGGTLQFRTATVILVRTASSELSPGFWKKTP
jgi:prepilin-type N-terminal cleavage/methylation domain-containing protein